MSDSMYGQQQRVQTVQPGATQKMSVDARNAMNMPKDEAGQRDWSNGLFTCLDDIFTCTLISKENLSHPVFVSEHSSPFFSSVGLSWFCPCVVYSQVKTRTEYLEAHGRPHPEGGELVGPDCALYGCLTVCGGCSVIFQVSFPPSQVILPMTRADTHDVDSTSSAPSFAIVTTSAAIPPWTSSRHASAGPARSRSRRVK